VVSVEVVKVEMLPKQSKGEKIERKAWALTAEACAPKLQWPKHAHSPTIKSCTLKA